MSFLGACPLSWHSAMERVPTLSDSWPKNIVPKAMHDMCIRAKQGDDRGAAEIDITLSGLHKYLFIESNPIPVKWALHRMGLIQDGIRLPLTWLSELSEGPLMTAMQNTKVI